MKLNIQIDLLDFFKSFMGGKNVMVDGEMPSSDSKQNPMVDVSVGDGPNYIDASDNISSKKGLKMVDIAKKFKPELRSKLGR